MSLPVSLKFSFPTTLQYIGRSYISHVCQLSLIEIGASLWSIWSLSIPQLFPHGPAITQLRMDIYIWICTRLICIYGICPEAHATTSLRYKHLCTCMASSKPGRTDSTCSARNCGKACGVYLQCRVVSCLFSFQLVFLSVELWFFYQRCLTFLTCDALFLCITQTDY